MKGSTPFAFISLPFVLGALSAAYAPVHIDAATLRLASCIAVTCSVTAFCMTKQKAALFSCILFFFTGIFCYACKAQDYIGEPLFRLQIVSASRNRLINAVDALPIQDSDCKALVIALLTGDRSGLSGEIRLNFQKGGGAHILALSGLHLGILAGLIGNMLRILGNTPPAKIIRATIIIAASTAYTIICGASASLVRALLFITFNSIGRLLPRRRAEPANCLLLAATIQLCLDPEAVRSVSFQLSYLACAGIIFIFPHMRVWHPAEKKTLSKRIWESVALSLCCQLTTAPVAWWHFRTLPKYFLLTNLLCLPLCEALIPLSLACTIINATGLNPAALCHVCEKCAELMLRTLEIIASIP